MDQFEGLMDLLHICRLEGEQRG